MGKELKILLGLLAGFFLIPQLVWGEENSTPSESEVEVQWEPLPQAQGYELEFQSLEKKDEKPLMFVTQEHKLKTQMPPGEYQFRIRSIDKENERGDWSESIKVVVKPYEVEMKSPVGGEIINALHSHEVVHFTWNSFPEVKGYVLRIWSERNQDVQSFKTRQTTVSLKLKSGRYYYWEVYPVLKSGIVYQRNQPPEKFVLYGRQVPDSQLLLIPDKNPIKAEWKRIKGVRYKLMLYYRKLLSEEWILAAEKELVGQGTWPFPQPLNPGEYKVTLQGSAYMHASSALSEEKFSIKPKLSDFETDKPSHLN